MDTAVRFTHAGLALALALSCGWCAVFSGRGQAARFLCLAAYATVLALGQLAALGRPVTWISWALAGITLVAILANVSFMIETWPGRGRLGSGHPDSGIRRPGRSADRGWRRDRGPGQSRGRDAS